jgi:2-oxoglutarate dehydrogenase E2 component (dihydrolipoamide succinyltransferase)
MVRSKATSAHVLQAVEVDFSRVEAARGALKRAWTEREGTPLTYLPFVARAVALALPEFPHLNAHVAGDSLTVYKAINLSLAVDLDRGGLVAPVIKNVAAMQVPDIARAIAKIAERARSHALKPDDMTEGTYSLTNNGSFGTFITAPIINQPQVAILSIDGVQRRPWVVTDDEGERIDIRPVGMLAQSFDHRAVDGAYSGAYLRRVKQILESREWIGEFLS